MMAENGYRMQTKTTREVVSKTMFSPDAKERDGGKSKMDDIFAILHETRSTGKLTVEFSQGSICGQPTFEERQKVTVP